MVAAAVEDQGFGAARASPSSSSSVLSSSSLLLLLLVLLLRVVVQWSTPQPLTRLKLHRSCTETRAMESMPRTRLLLLLLVLVLVLLMLVRFSAAARGSCWCGCPTNETKELDDDPTAAACALRATQKAMLPQFLPGVAPRTLLTLPWLCLPRAVPLSAQSGEMLTTGNSSN
jgi:hypothetical protein